MFKFVTTSKNWNLRVKQKCEFNPVTNPLFVIKLQKTSSFYGDIWLSK